MAVERLIEGKEALQVAPLGRQGILRLPGDFGHQVESRQVAEAILGCFDLYQNVTGETICTTAGEDGYGFRHGV